MVNSGIHVDLKTLSIKKVSVKCLEKHNYVFKMLVFYIR